MGSTLQDEVRSLHPGPEFAIRARADANAALRLRNERATVPALGVQTQAMPEAQVDFATVMAQVTELVAAHVALFIAIAFPQRDVHLDMPGALGIELAGPMDPDATRAADGGASAAASGRGRA